MARRRGFGSIIERANRAGHYVRFHHDGSQVERYGGPTEKAARAQLARVHALLASRVPFGQVMAEVFGDLDGSTLTFRKAVEEYARYAATHKRESTLRGDRSRLRIICEASWAGKTMASIRRADLKAWAADRRAPTQATRRRKRRPGETLAEFRRATDKMETVKVPGCSGATVNRDLSLISAVYTWAQEHEHVGEDVNPARGVKHFKEERGREVYLTAEECRALIDASPPTVRPLVLAAIHTGMRRGELLALRWRAVDLVRGEVTVEAATAKSGRVRQVRMTPDLRATLKGLKEARPAPALDGSDRVFVLADGEPLRLSTLRVAWRALLRTCEAVPLAKRQVLRFHDLRHTAASLMVAAGVPIFDVAKVLGHSTVAVTMRYAHFAPEAGQDAADRLAAALTSPTTKRPRKRA